MKCFTPTLLVFAVVLSGLGAEGDDTLKYYLSKSDCVALGTIISEPTWLSIEAGVEEYVCDFKVSESFKGDGLTNGVTTQVLIVRFERGAIRSAPSH